MPCDHAEVRKAIESLITFAIWVDRSTEPAQLLQELLDWHRRVQAGKIAGGVPKREWVAREDKSRRLLRPSPRFQRSQRPAHPEGRRLTHPYRLEPFAAMLRENGVLPAE